MTPPISAPDALPLARSPLFFLDYDGTLAPIVDDPAAAVPHPEAVPLLRVLHRRYPLWIVTGRDAASLERFVPLPVRLIGLHGAQEGVLGGDVQRLMPESAADALSRLRERVPSGEGIEVEEKTDAFALHYRHAPDPEAARARLEAWAAEAPDTLEAVWGKHVMELRPKGLDKGTAVARIATDITGRVPVYLGDDVTDEDAFAALQAASGDGVAPSTLTIKVGDGPTRARYRLADVDAVIAYLKRYV
jgi:trehalose 6-phosphate phosphatase